MAKSQARSNREPKKPKQPKKVASPADAVSWPANQKDKTIIAPSKKK